MQLRQLKANWKESMMYQGKKATHKFHAKPTEINGIRFASKAESRYYNQLKLLEKSGEVVGFLRQTPIHFSSGIKYVLDFLVFYADGTCCAIDVKGFETPEFKLKLKLLEDEYPWLDFKIVK